MPQSEMDTEARLQEAIETWRGLVTRWPGRWYEIAPGCDMVSRMALDCLRVEGVVEIDRKTGWFRGVPEKVS